jgi:hypothetical protein
MILIIVAGPFRELTLVSSTESPALIARPSPRCLLPKVVRPSYVCPEAYSRAAREASTLVRELREEVADARNASAPQSWQGFVACRPDRTPSVQIDAHRHKEGLLERACCICVLVNVLTGERNSNVKIKNALADGGFAHSIQMLRRP